MEGKLPVNHAILGNLQDVFNLLPGLSAPLAPQTQTNSYMNGNGAGHLTNGTAKDGPGLPHGLASDSELARAMSVKTNDQLMNIYLSSLIRAITAFHDLIENKISNRNLADEKERSKIEARKEKEKKGADATKDKDGKVVNGNTETKGSESETKK